MNQNQLLGPMIIRYVFFALNLFFTIYSRIELGWNIITILLAVFATRDFVYAVRLTQVYFKIKNHNDKK